MSHMPLSLINRLNKTESAIFKLWMLCFQRISFQIMSNSQQLSLCHVAALKSLPVHRYSVVICTFMVLWDCKIQQLSGNRVALNTGLGGVKEVACTIISHGQTQ